MRVLANPMYLCDKKCYEEIKFTFLFFTETKIKRTV